MAQVVEVEGGMEMRDATRRPTGESREVVIEPKGPFSWREMTDVLSHFPPMRRHWRDNADVIYLTFVLDREYTPVAVALRDGGGVLRGEVVGTTQLEAVSSQVARIFSLDHDGSGYPAVGERDPQIGRLMAMRPGLRPLCFTSPYETAAWAIISQRISTRQAAAVQERLIADHGHLLRVGGEEVHCFPAPERLLGLTSVPGLSGQKVERLRGVAQAALDGLLDAEHLRALGPEAAPAALQAIPGIGPFWASGIYLRGCGIPDVFPDEPLAVAALGHLHGLGDAPDRDIIRRLTDVYRPYRMWVCFLLRVAAGRGDIPGIAGREGDIRRKAGR
jgi:DNA-3-methyladenine glycosylase II